VRLGLVLHSTCTGRISLNMVNQRVPVPEDTWYKHHHVFTTLDSFVGHTLLAFPLSPPT